MPDSPRQHWLGTPIEPSEARASDPPKARHELRVGHDDPRSRAASEPNLRRAHLLFGLFTVALLVAAALVLRLWG